MILDGTLPRIDRVSMTGGRDRPFHWGKHKCHGVNARLDTTAHRRWSVARVCRGALW